MVVTSYKVWAQQSEQLRIEVQESMCPDFEIAPCKSVLKLKNAFQSLIFSFQNGA